MHIKFFRDNDLVKIVPFDKVIIGFGDSGSLEIKVKNKLIAVFDGNEWYKEDSDETYSRIEISKEDL